MNQKTDKVLAETFLNNQAKNRERQRKYREKKHQQGYKQITVFVERDSSVPIQKLVQEWQNYLGLLPLFESVVRDLSKNLSSGGKPSTKRPLLGELADFLAKIQKQNQTQESNDTKKF